MSVATPEATVHETCPLPRPAVLAPNFDEMPAALKLINRWVTFRMESREDSRGWKWTKVPLYPYIATNGIHYKASATKPGSWGNHHRAKITYDDHRATVDGLGFVLNGDGIIGIDLDHVIDNAGNVAPWALEYVAECGTYSEKSGGGHGIRIIGRGALPDGCLGKKNSAAGREIYASQRYVTITGHRLPDTPAEVNDISAFLDKRFQEFISPTEAKREKRQTETLARARANGYVPNGHQSGSNSLTDGDIIRIASLAKNGAEFDKLWRGDMSTYADDHSRADLALLGTLAFYAGPDRQRIISLFEQSGLVREKWLTREDYRNRSLDTVLNNMTTFFIPRSASGSRFINGADNQGHTTQTTVGGEIGNATIDSTAAVYAQTDYGLAERLIHRHGRDLLYCFPWAKWLSWDKSRWTIDDAGAVMQMAKQTVRAIWGDVAAEENLDKRDELIDFIQRSESATRLNAMIALARDEVPVLNKELDCDPWLFNCFNGTIDLRTGELKVNRRDDRITKLCNTVYDPAAPCPTWLKFLDATFGGDDVLISFLQRLTGYSLTGDTREHILAIMWGTGSNGKSTLLNALFAALGTDYTMKAVADLLLAKRNEGHPTERADLFGRRLVCCTETAAGAKFNEALMKELTGGDPVRARRMREDFWEFIPTHKIWLVTNHKPVVQGTDHAVWRRLALIPFNVQFWNPDRGETGPAHLRQDKALGDKLAAEREGILAWAVRGCLEWQRHGLDVPETVRAATREYRAENDKIGQFIADRCVMLPEATVRARDIYTAYQDWCARSGETAITQHRFGASLTERGVTRYTNNGTCYRGIGIRVDD